MIQGALRHIRSWHTICPHTYRKGSHASLCKPTNTNCKNVTGTGRNYEFKLIHFRLRYCFISDVRSQPMLFIHLKLKNNNDPYYSVLRLIYTICYCGMKTVRKLQSSTGREISGHGVAGCLSQKHFPLIKNIF